MNNLTSEFINIYPNPFLQPDQIAPASTDTSIAQVSDCAPLPLHDGGMPAHMAEHHHAPQTGTKAIFQHEPAITLPCEAMNNHRQLEAFTFASNSGVQQQNVASTSRGSIIPFDGSAGGMSAWNQDNGGAGAGMAFNNLINPQAGAGHSAVDHATQNSQHAMANGFNHLPLNDPSFCYLPNHVLRQPVFNSTHNHLTYNQENFGPPFQLNQMAQLRNLNALQQQAFGYQQAIAVLAGAYQPEAMATGQQAFVSYPNNAADALPKQMQRLTTHSPLTEGELASPAINATEDHTLQDTPFATYHSPTAQKPVLNNHQAIGHRQLPEVPAYQHQVNMGERPTVPNHSDATNTPQEQIHRSLTDSPLADEPLTPPSRNAPSSGLAMVAGDAKEHNRDLVSPAKQNPAPLYLQGLFSHMADSPAAPSPVHPWVSEQAGPENLQGNSLQAAEMPAPQPVPAAMPFTFTYGFLPSEGHSSRSFSKASTPQAQKPIRFEFYTGPKSAGAGSSRKQQRKRWDEDPRPAKRARKTRSFRNPLYPRAVEAPAQGSGESFPLFAPLPSNDAIPEIARAPEQVGASTTHSLNDRMTLYNIFVAMREENDRNRAAGARNANGDETFTWDESDIKLLAFLRCPSRR